MELEKLAAIDIGSNAMRLLICNVIEDKEKTIYKKIALIRLPIRLGAEAFTAQSISPITSDRFLKGMKAYQYLMEVHQVKAYRACATSAMREAMNGEKLAQRIKEETGIQVDIINGKEEAKIIHQAHFKENLDPLKQYMYVDVGGGSTEITLFAKGEPVRAKSFEIGTIRILNQMVKDATWNELEEFVRGAARDFNDLETIGSGGNINKLYKLSGRSYPKPMELEQLQHLNHMLLNMTEEDRVRRLKLNTDRADVIVPASRIFVSCMEWANSQRVHVPKIGLADGLIMQLNDEIHG